MALVKPSWHRLPLDLDPPEEPKDGPLPLPPADPGDRIQARIDELCAYYTHLGFGTHPNGSFLGRVARAISEQLHWPVVVTVVPFDGQGGVVLAGYALPEDALLVEPVVTVEERPRRYSPHSTAAPNDDDIRWRGDNSRLCTACEGTGTFEMPERAGGEQPCFRCNGSGLRT